jgi:hypothetical protein
MNNIVGNLGGAIQTLPKGSFVGGKQRGFGDTLVLNTQAAATIVGVARVPLPFVFLGILLCTDTSLATATIAFGNAGNGNSALYAAAATFTATDTPTLKGKTSVLGTEITSGFDSVTGLATSYSSSSGFGGAYEDVIMTTAVASLPGSGNLRIVFEYAID